MTASRDPFLPSAVATRREAGRGEFAWVSPAASYRSDDEAAYLFGNPADSLAAVSIESELSRVAEGFQPACSIADLQFPDAETRGPDPASRSSPEPLIAKTRSRRHDVEDGDGGNLPAAVRLRPDLRSRGGFLMAKTEVVLGGGQISCGRFQHLPVGVTFPFECGQTDDEPVPTLPLMKPRRTISSRKRSSCAAPRMCRSISKVIWLMRSRFSRCSVSRA